jgi:hypothetical protein
MEFAVMLAGTVFGQADLWTGLAFAIVLSPYGHLTDAILAGVRKWHKGINDRFDNIDSLVQTIRERQTVWAMPADMLTDLINHRNELQVLINKCRSNGASALDRAYRNSLLDATVAYCLLDVKTWAYGKYSDGVMTVDDIHSLAFLMPGENGGNHKRAEATDVIAEVKVRIVSESIIKVVVDQSAGENAGPVRHGWPAGVKQALIVISSVDTQTEALRLMTDHVHTDIEMPAGSRGKQFVIKASFLRHVGDTPRFGSEPTFSMPLTTEDLAGIHDTQSHEEHEARMSELQRHRQEIERIEAELKKSENA